MSPPLLYISAGAAALETSARWVWRATAPTLLQSHRPARQCNQEQDHSMHLPCPPDSMPSCQPRFFSLFPARRTANTALVACPHSGPPQHQAPELRLYFERDRPRKGVDEASGAGTRSSTPAHYTVNGSLQVRPPMAMHRPAPALSALSASHEARHLGDLWSMRRAGHVEGDGAEDADVASVSDAGISSEAL